MGLKEDVLNALAPDIGALNEAVSTTLERAKTNDANELLELLAITEGKIDTLSLSKRKETDFELPLPLYEARLRYDTLEEISKNAYEGMKIAKKGDDEYVAYADVVSALQLLFAYVKKIEETLSPRAGPNTKPDLKMTVSLTNLRYFRNMGIYSFKDGRLCEEGSMNDKIPHMQSTYHSSVEESKLFKQAIFELS